MAVSRQLNLVQGHTTHVMSSLTWRDREPIQARSLSSLYHILVVSSLSDEWQLEHNDTKHSAVNLYLGRTEFESSSIGLLNSCV
jgi:hypothetical protein